MTNFLFVTIAHVNVHAVEGIYALAKDNFQLCDELPVVIAPSDGARQEILNDEEGYKEVMDKLNLILTKYQTKFMNIRKQVGYNSKNVKRYRYMYFATAHFSVQLFRWMLKGKDVTTRSSDIRSIMDKSDSYKYEGLYKKKDMLYHVTQLEALLDEMECLIYMDSMNIHHIITNVFMPDKKDEIVDHLEKTKKKFYVMSNTEYNLQTNLLVGTLPYEELQEVMEENDMEEID